MANYIDRNEIFPNGVFFANEKAPLTSLDELIKRIWSIPTADVVEVKHGRWVDDPDIWRCDQCLEWLDIMQGTADMNYCPHCGARMDGGNE